MSGPHVAGSSTQHRTRGARPRSTEEIAGLEALAVTLAVEAGTFIVAERPRRVGVADTKSSDTDVVTIMDRRSEQLLRDRLAAARPLDGVLGEEGGSSAGRAGGAGGASATGLTWVVDPIDGTVNYLYDIPGYSVSVAVVEGDPTVPGAWRPLAGAVCSPTSGEVFHAGLGSGATVSPMSARQDHGARGLPLRVNDVQELRRALVGTGFGYLPQMRARQGAVVATLLPELRDIRRIGSAAVDLCSVATGRLDAFFESGLNPWDLAAGWLVLTEAGGTVSGLYGAPPSSAMTVGAGPALHGRLVERLEQLHLALGGLDDGDGTQDVERANDTPGAGVTGGPG